MYCPFGLRPLSQYIKYSKFTSYFFNFSGSHHLQMYIRYFHRNIDSFFARDEIYYTGDKVSKCVNGTKKAVLHSARRWLFGKDYFRHLDIEKHWPIHYIGFVCHPYRSTHLNNTV